MWLGAASAPEDRRALRLSPRSAQRVFRLGERGYPERDPRGSPFQMPTRLADGLGLESDLGHACARPFAPPPDSRFHANSGNLGPPRRPPGREASLGCSNDQGIAHFSRMSSDLGFRVRVICCLEFGPAGAIFSATRARGGMADAPDLGSGAERLGGSSPPARTTTSEPFY
jgi:hypothetical protein